MIRYPKTILKSQTLVDMIRDVGTHITNGNLILTKGLVSVGLDRQSSIIGGYPKSYSIPYELAGNNCCIDMSSGVGQIRLSTTKMDCLSKCGGWQAFCFDTYYPYFDSTSGSTAGKRLMVYPGGYLMQANSDGTQTQLSAGRVDWSYTINNYITFGNAIIGENSTTLFVLSQWLGNYINTNTGGQDVGSNGIYAVNKSTFTGSILSLTQTLSYQAQFKAPKILGKTVDNKLVIVNYPAPSSGQTYMYGGSISYSVLDLTAGTLSVPTAVLLTSSASSLTTCTIPSSVSDESSDATNWKYYIPACDINSSIPTTVKRLYLPKTIGTQINPLAGDMTSCTLSSLPTGVTIPNPNNAPTTFTSLATSACLYLNQKSVNTKEYVVVLNMAYANLNDLSVGYSALGNSYSNGCDVSRHGLFVFQIDPTNSANLIYKSSINDGTAFGVNAPLYNTNKSADNTLIVLSNANSFVILYWNVTTESYSYSKPFSISSGIGRISLDTSNRIWVQEYNSSNIYVFSLNNSMNIVVSFSGSLNSVNYTGSNLSQNVIVNSFDLTSVRYVKTIKLEVIGPAIFTSSNSTTTTVTTSATADTVVALTITGPGSIKVVPSLVV